MIMNQFIVKHVIATGNFTKVKFEGGEEILLRPFIYIRPQDVIEFTPSVNGFKEIYKVFEDRGKNELKKVKIHPPYEKKEVICLPPHRFEVIFRERKSSEDWKMVKELERFHYRGKGLNKIVGRRTVLLAEIKEFGVIGYGILSASVVACAPRFKLLSTNFSDQMRSGLINQIVRIPRIVIHPEFRGLHLGALIAKHLVNYAQEYWDINHYTPIMIEVIAAMTEYHKFFEQAGFIKVGYTTGYKGQAIIPKYGNGSFSPRDSSEYKFMRNQQPKPYLVYPLSPEIKQKLKPYIISKALSFMTKKPKLKEPLKFENLTMKYRVKNGSTERTNIVKEVFGVDSEHAFSPVITGFSLLIEPGEVVLFTGASGSGKSTILKLLTTNLSSLENILEWSGTFRRLPENMVEVLNTDFDFAQPLIDQIKIGKDIRESIELLNSVGLTEAHLYIKRPNQISDGQKYRFAIAKLCDSEKPIWVADEFASTLNPEMAAIVAKGLRKLAYKYGATVLLGAPHISYFVGSLLPNKIFRLRWGMRALIYSLKVKNFHHDGNKILLSVLNNGNTPLTNLQVGLIAENGVFRLQGSISYLSQEQIHEISIELENDTTFSALVIKTDEGVGDILYTE